MMLKRAMILVACMLFVLSALLPHIEPYDLRERLIALGLALWVGTFLV